MTNLTDLTDLTNVLDIVMNNKSTLISSILKSDPPQPQNVFGSIQPDCYRIDNTHYPSITLTISTDVKIEYNGVYYYIYSTLIRWGNKRVDFSEIQEPEDIFSVGTVQDLCGLTFEHINYIKSIYTDLIQAVQTKRYSHYVI